MTRLIVSDTLPVDRFAAFDYLTDVRNLPGLLSRAIEIEVIGPPPELKRGAEAHLTMTRFGFTQSVRWHVEDVLRGSSFSFRQVEGVFAAWTHSLRFEDAGAGGTRVTDLIAYAVPGGVFGRAVDEIVIKADLERMLRARLRRAHEYFTRPRPTSERLAESAASGAGTDPSYQSKDA